MALSRPKVRRPKPVKAHVHRLVTLPPNPEGDVFRCMGCKARLKTADGGILVGQFFSRKEDPWPFRRVSR